MEIPYAPAGKYFLRTFRKATEKTFEAKTKSCSSLSRADALKCAVL